MISFHFPPIAARAAVNGHPPTGLARRGRDSRRGSLPTGTFLTGCIARNTFLLYCCEMYFCFFCADQASRAGEGPRRWGGSPSVMEGSNVRGTRYTIECDISCALHYCRATAPLTADAQVNAGTGVKDTAMNTFKYLRACLLLCCL